MMSRNFDKNFENFAIKYKCKNEFKDDNKNQAADPEVGFRTRPILKLYGPQAMAHEAMPTAQE